MAVSIVVGGQYGSEGKGKVAHFLARERGASVAVRVGGPNSGHTVYDDHGRKFVLQHLPTAAVLPDVLCLLAAGSYIDVDRLLYEILTTGLSSQRLRIDPQAVIISQQHRAQEHLSGWRADIGSTLTGTGAAVIARLMRSRKIAFARDCHELQPYLAETKPLLRSLLDRGARVVIEGTQGFGLSVLHTANYPYATSRDTTAAGFLSEVGLSPFDVDEIALVIRSYPIRVPGNSGPLIGECTWDDVTDDSNSNTKIEEITSVTKSIRRVAKFSPEVVRAAIASNQPSLIVLNHADYWDHSSKNKEPSQHIARKVREIEMSIQRRIDFIGTSENRLAYNAPASKVAA